MYVPVPFVQLFLMQRKADDRSVKAITRARKKRAAISIMMFLLAPRSYWYEPAGASSVRAIRLIRGDKVPSCMSCMQGSSGGNIGQSFLGICYVKVFGHLVS